MLIGLSHTEEYSQIITTWLNYPFKKIVNILVSIKGKVISPVQSRVKKFIKKHSLLKKLKSKKDLVLIVPVSHRDMLIQEENSRLILTYSDDVQREAFFLMKTPHLTLERKPNG